MFNFLKSSHASHGIEKQASKMYLNQFTVTVLLSPIDSELILVTSKAAYRKAKPSSAPIMEASYGLKYMPLKSK